MTETILMKLKICFFYRTPSDTTCHFTTGSWGYKTKALGSPRGGWSTRTPNQASRWGAEPPPWRRVNLRRNGGEPKRKWRFWGTVEDVCRIPPPVPARRYRRASICSPTLLFIGNVINFFTFRIYESTDKFSRCTSTVKNSYIFIFIIAFIRHVEKQKKSFI